MPTRADIRDWVRGQTLVEPDDYDDSKVNNIINQGIRDLAVRFDWPFLAKTATVSLVVGSDTYALPADMLKLGAVTLVGTSTRLAETSPSRVWEDEGDNPSTGTPDRFWLWGNSIVVRPIPDSTGTLKFWYYRSPQLLNNDTDSPEWSPEFHMVLADYAAQMLWEREEDFEKASVHAQRYAAGVESMARFYLNRAGDAPMIVGEPRRRRRGPRMPWLEV